MTKTMTRITDLDGALLDDWCARAYGWWKTKGEDEQWYWMGRTFGKGAQIQVRCDLYRPSTDFAQGGPLLDFGGVTVEAPFGITYEVPHVAWSGHSFKTDDNGQQVPVVLNRQEGYGYLRAGMRSWVAKNFGFQVPAHVDWTKERDYDD